MQAEISENLKLAAFNALFQSGEKGIILLNRQHEILNINPAGRRFFHTEQSVSLTGTPLAALASQCSQSMADRLSDLLLHRQNPQFDIYCPHLDSWLTIEYIPMPEGAMLYVQDVTVQKKQTETIEDLARFPEETWNPVMKFAEDGRILYTNSRCSPILETWETHPLGQTPEYVTREIQRALAENSAREVDVNCDNGQIYSILLAPVIQSRAVYVYGRDISRLKQNEEELIAHRDHLEELVRLRTDDLKEAVIKAEAASKAKSAFLANMSHEIRTPLTAIIGFAENLLESDLSHDERERFLNTIIRSGRHLSGIINDVLDLSKIEANKIEIEKLDVDTFELLADIQSLMSSRAGEKGLTFRLDYVFPLPRTIKTDSVRLRQILINLCTNAIKFTSTGSVHIEIVFEPETGMLAFNICDTGIGMTADQLQRIFEPFTQADISTTRKFGGTGLGLTLSRNLAELLGGSLSAESTPGEGSCFRLLVASGDIARTTLVAQQPVYASIPDAPLPVSGNKLAGNVLLAEDTPELQALSMSIVKRTGATVTLVENGQQAVDAALSGKFKLVLMDMQMPVMDGYTAVETLRAQGYNGPIVAMTANTLQQDRDRAMNAGCDGFVGKPIDRLELFRVLSLYLDQDNQPPALVSSVLEEDPDLVDLIEKFVGKLPRIINDLEDCYTRQDYPSLRQQLHGLKGMGGSYGYPIISNIAAKMEQDVINNTLDEFPAYFASLREITQQASAALE